MLKYKKMQKQQYLSKNQKIVLDHVEKSNQPLKAYSILYNVQKKGLKAPLQVYRALAVSYTHLTLPTILLV